MIIFWGLLTLMGLFILGGTVWYIFHNVSIETSLTERHKALNAEIKGLEEALRYEKDLERKAALEKALAIKRAVKEETKKEIK